MVKWIYNEAFIHGHEFIFYLTISSVILTIVLTIMFAKKGIKDETK